MEIKSIPISEMHPAKYNPRVDLQPSDLEYKAIENSINSFGYIEPIVWNKRTGNIVGGHQRYKILRAQGKTEAEVVVVDFDEEKEKAANLALNKAVGLWDEKKVNELLKELSETEWNMKDYNFDDFDLNTCVQDTEKDKRNNPVDVPKRVEKGDIWILGNHRLACGDSADHDLLERLIKGNKIDLMITDPPYNVNYQGTASLGHEKIHNDNMSDEDFYLFLRGIFSNAFPYLKGGCPFYIFMSSLAIYEAVKATKDSGLHYSQNLVWVKDQLVLSGSDYQQRGEQIIYGWKKGATGEKHYFKRDRTQDTALNFHSTDFSKLTKEQLLKFIEDLKKEYEDFGDVILEPRTKRNTLHPTMKPVDLIGRLINNSSTPKDNVLDLFGGSGTTIIACEQLHRNGFMVEYEPHYCDCILDRWEKLTGNKAEKEKTNV